MTTILVDRRTGVEVLLDTARLRQFCSICHTEMLTKPIVAVTSDKKGWTCAGHLDLRLLELPRQTTTEPAPVTPPRVSHRVLREDDGYGIALQAACNQETREGMELKDVLWAGDGWQVAVFVESGRHG